MFEKGIRKLFASPFSVSHDAFPTSTKDAAMIYNCLGRKNCSSGDGTMATGRGRRAWQRIHRIENEKKKIEQKSMTCQKDDRKTDATMVSIEIVVVVIVVVMVVVVFMVEIVVVIVVVVVVVEVVVVVVVAMDVVVFRVVVELPWFSVFPIYSSFFDSLPLISPFLSGHPASTHIKGYLLTMCTQWNWLLNLLNSHETHKSHAVDG